MSLFQSPSINRDGLLFYYDINNTKKSWKGKPTTNLIYNPTLSLGSSGFGQYGPNPISIATSDIVPTTFGVPRNVLQVKCDAGGWGAAFYWGAGSQTPGTTYTISYYARCISTQSAGMWFSNQNGSGDQNNLSHGSTITNEWKRFSYTATLDLAKVTWYVWGAQGESLQFCDFQFEVSSFATPFVDGGRSTTQSVLDLTGNYILTASSGVIYNTDNTFEFSNSPNVSYYDLNTSSLISGTQSFTIEACVYQYSFNDGNVIIGNYGTGYAGVSQLWFATHGLYIGGAVPYFTSYPGVGTFYLAATRSGSGTTKLYLNGVLNNTSTCTTSIAANIPWRIGADVNGGAEPFHGKIYFIRVYNRELSSAEIYSNFCSQRSIYGL